jgi:hypothetical protein
LLPAVGWAPRRRAGSASAAGAEPVHTGAFDDVEDDDLAG